MTIETGATVPDFTLVDATDDGQLWNLRDALAKGPVVVSVYKSSCRASKVAFPFLEKLYHAYPKEQFTVWGIALDSANITRSFGRRYELTFPLLVDGEGYPTAQAYGVTETPTVFLLNPDGTVSWQTVAFEKTAMQDLSRTLATMLDSPYQDIIEGSAEVPAQVPG